MPHWFTAGILVNAKFKTLPFESCQTMGRPLQLLYRGQCSNCEFPEISNIAITSALYDSNHRSWDNYVLEYQKIILISLYKIYKIFKMAVLKMTLNRVWYEPQDHKTYTYLKFSFLGEHFIRMWSLYQYWESWSRASHMPYVIHKYCLNRKRLNFDKQHLSAISPETDFWVNPSFLNQWRRDDLLSFFQPLDISQVIFHKFVVHTTCFRSKSLIMHTVRRDDIDMAINTWTSKYNKHCSICEDFLVDSI